jgi:hypothetical protein
MHYVQDHGYVEASGKKVCSKREMVLRLAKACGFNNDSAEFTRLLIENRVTRQSMEDAWNVGATARRNQS